MTTMIAIKHPPGLRVLFFAELWERFGFYCIQTLLVLYLTQKLHWSDTRSYDVFSAFSALIYATPVIGGYLADRLLGYRQAIYIGTVFYIIGYFALSTLNPHIFNFALAALICGNGFFKPNVSSLLGKLYTENDPRRDSGFTLFYLGINIGSLISPIICTYLAVNYSWHYGFMSAGVGMLICLVTCLTGFHKIGDHGHAPVDMRRLSTSLFYIACFIALIIFGLLLGHSRLVSNAVIVVGIVAFLGLIASAMFETKSQRHRLIALMVLIAFSVIFWALYVQCFSSLILFTQRNVDRTIFGYVIPTGMFNSINPFFIIVLSPILAILWLRLNQTHSRYNPSTAMKFALATIAMGLGFLVLVFGMKISDKTGMMAWGWLILSYFLQTMGELSLSPIGLAAVTALAPPRLVGMVMGIWFLTLSAAYSIGGRIADLTAIPKSMINNPLLSGPIYQTNYFHFGLAGVLIGLLLLTFVPVLKHMMAD